MALTFRELMAVVDKAYKIETGPLIEILSPTGRVIEDKALDLGDGLAQFITVELKEVIFGWQNDPFDPDRDLTSEELDAAYHVMETASEEVSAVVAALGALKL